MSEQIAYLPVPARSLKMLRETLCRAQSLLASRHDTDRLQMLTDAIDMHRPLGPNGRHGDLHTDTCGCEEADRV